MRSQFDQKDQSIGHAVRVRLDFIAFTGSDNVRELSDCIGPVVKGPGDRIDYLVHCSDLELLHPEVPVIPSSSVHHLSDSELNIVVIRVAVFQVPVGAPVPAYRVHAVVENYHQIEGVLAEEVVQDQGCVCRVAVEVAVNREVPVGVSSEGVSFALVEVEA